MQFPKQRPRAHTTYGEPRNKKGIRVPRFPKLKMGPTMTMHRRVMHKRMHEDKF